MVRIILLVACCYVNILYSQEEPSFVKPFPLRYHFEVDNNASYKITIDSIGCSGSQCFKLCFEGDYEKVIFKTKDKDGNSKDEKIDACGGIAAKGQVYILQKTDYECLLCVWSIGKVKNKLLIDSISKTDKGYILSWKDNTSIVSVLIEKIN